jgi:hypothetical protein
MKKQAEQRQEEDDLDDAIAEERRKLEEIQNSHRVKRLSDRRDELQNLKKIRENLQTGDDGHSFSREEGDGDDSLSRGRQENVSRKDERDRRERSSSRDRGRSGRDEGSRRGDERDRRERSSSRDRGHQSLHEPKRRGNERDSPLDRLEDELRRRRRRLNLKLEGDSLEFQEYEALEHRRKLELARVQFRR